MTVVPHPPAAASGFIWQNKKQAVLFPSKIKKKKCAVPHNLGTTDPCEIISPETVYSISLVSPSTGSLKRHPGCLLRTLRSQKHELAGAVKRVSFYTFSHLTDGEQRPKRGIDLSKEVSPSCQFKWSTWFINLFHPPNKYVIGSCNVPTQHYARPWEKMVGKTDVVPALLELTASWGDRRCWEEGGGKSSSKGTSKSPSVGAPGVGTVLNISYRSQKFHLFSLFCHELLSFFLSCWAKLGTPGKKSQKSTYYSLSREELRVLAKMGPQLLTGCSVLALQSDDTLERAACHPHRFWHQYFVFKETPFPLTQALDLVRLTLLLSRTGQMIRPGQWTYSIVLDTTIGSGWAHKPSQIVENDIQVICCSLRERDCSPFTEFVELGLQLQPQGGIFDTPSREIV